MKTGIFLYLGFGVSGGKSLLKGAEKALEYAMGHKKGSLTHKVKVPAQVDVHSIRNHLHMTRKEFSDEFGFSARTVEKWERNERVPEGPTRAYLIVIAKNPQAVRNALSGSSVIKRASSISTTSRSHSKLPKNHKVS
jgi:putative transcriptional regulator